MTAENEQEIDQEKYKNEIASLKRLNSRFISFRNWLINTCLASLAFAMTIFIQIRLQGILISEGLAATTITFLSLSVLGAIYTKVAFEMAGMVSDVKDLTPLYPVLIELVQKSEQGTDEEKQTVTGFFERLQAHSESLSNQKNEFKPFSELYGLIFTCLTLAIGLVSLSAFVWIYLFSV